MNKLEKSKNILWLAEPEKHDYPAAFSYLNLLYEKNKSNRFVQKLKKAKMSAFKAKDIFRASQLSLLGVSNSHVDKNTQKIKEKKTLSPLLLVRDSTMGKLIVADGYHRLCAVYLVNEDALIPCKII
jgi:hypothetical protein